MVTVLSGWQSSFFIQGQTLGIAVDRLSDGPAVQAGDAVEVRGFTAPGKFAPLVVARSVTILGKQKLPTAPLLNANDLAAGAQDAQWIALRGLVRSASIKPAWGRPVLFLDLDIGGGKMVSVRIRDFAQETWAKLPGATVTVRGVCGTVFNENRQFLGLRLFVSNLDDVNVEEPAPGDPFDLPLRPLDSPMQFDGREGAIARIKVRGAVTYSKPGFGLYLQDNTSGIYIESGQMTPVALGSQVEAVGYPAAGTYSPELADAAFRVVGPSRPIAPLARSASEIIVAKDDSSMAPYNSMLVQLKAIVLDQYTRDDEARLLLRDGAVTFTARLPPYDATRISLPKGSLIAVTGICQATIDPATDTRLFRLVLRSPADIVVLKKGPWWTADHALWVAVILAVVVLWMFVWLAWVRRQASQLALAASEMERKQADAKLRAIHDFVVDGLIVTDESGLIENVNPACESVFGYEHSELPGSNISTLFVPREAGESISRNASRYADAPVLALAASDVMGRRKDGSLFPVDLSVSTFELDSGRRHCAIVRDVSARQEVAAALELSEKRYASVTQGMSIGIWDWDLLTNEQYWSSRMREMLGIAEEDSAPRFDESDPRVHPADLDRVMNSLKRHVQGLGAYDAEFRVRREDGKYLWVRSVGQAIWDESGKPVRLVGSMDDITHRRRAEAHLRAVVDYAIDGLITLNERGEIEGLNPAGERIFGYEAAELLGRSLDLLLLEPYLGERGDYFARCTTNGEACFVGPEVTEILGKRKDETVFPLDLTICGFELEDGKHYIATTRDITVRRRTERNVIDSSTRFKAVVDCALDGLITINSRSTIETFNRSAERIFGYKSAEVVGCNVSLLMPEPDKSGHDGYVGNYLKTGEAKIIGVAREVSGRHRDGSIFPMDLSISAFQLGQDLAFVGVVRDISARKALEQNNAALMSAIVNSSDDAIISQTLDGHITSWNPGAERLFGFEAGEAVGQHINILIPADRLVEHKRILERLNDGEEVQRLETVRKRRDGSIVDVSISISLVKGADGKRIGASKIVRDIGNRKRVERELQEHAQALESVNRELDAFAYAASHDLKAPLRVIDNCSKWIEEDLAPHLTAETRENMGLLRGRVRRMEKLLNDMLEYSRIGRSSDATHGELISGRSLMRNIVELLSPPAGFTVEIDPGLEAIEIFRMPVQSVLLNLISNAIKHHDKEFGSIHVSVKDLDDLFLFSVRDDGPGIAPRFHEQIFEMFQTLRPRDQVEGSGMGLAMVRKHVARVGGEISLESTVGEGSIFHFTWPKPRLGPREIEDREPQLQLTSAGATK